MGSHSSHGCMASRAMSKQRSSILYWLKIPWFLSSRACPGIQEIIMNPLLLDSCLRRNDRNILSHSIRDDRESSSPPISESSSRIYPIPPSSIGILGSYCQRWQRRHTLILHLGILDSHSSTILTSPHRSVAIPISRYTASSRNKSEASSHQSASTTTRHY